MLDYATLRIWWRDREGNEAATHFYVPSSLSWQAIYDAAVSGFIPHIAPLTDARCSRIDVTWRHKVLQPAHAPEGSNVKRKALLLFQNDDELLDALTMVSVNSNIFETSGPYAGIRVRPETMSDLVEMFSSFPFVMQTGDPFGPQFVAGALAY